jgi:hypothetical protein
MTSLIAWIGVDSRGPASAYLASDSRISWASGAHWDIGRKLFTSEKSADLFDDAVMLPSESVLVLTVGSGESTVARYDAAWRKTEVGRTSRAVFSAFCEALKSGADHFSGGAPQLVGIYRRGHGETFGVIYQGERYVLGVSISSDQAGKLAVEWRNELFERCDGPSMERLEGAQRHSRPRRVT